MEIKKILYDKLWDLWCISSVVGIWPRYIEPRLLITTKLTLELELLPEAFDGVTLLQFSDLHLNRRTSDRFLKRIQKKIKKLNPDIIAFTGDFLCFSDLSEKERLKIFFHSLPKAPLGNFAVLGNHDYSDYIGLNENGDYDIHEREKIKNTSLTKKALKRLIKTSPISKRTTIEAATVAPHPELERLLRSTSFQLLHNETAHIQREGALLNISGFGEYMAGRMLPENTFQNYDRSTSGILLLHNPDGIKNLNGWPGEVVLSGHTHAGQVNLPLLAKRFIVLENPALKRGLFQFKERFLYVNRGVGSTFTFRWFAPPELLLLTLKRKKSVP